MNHPMMGSSNQEEEDVAVGKQEDDTQKRPYVVVVFVVVVVYWEYLIYRITLLERFSNLLDADIFYLLPEPPINSIASTKRYAEMKTTVQ